jgi:hypothetical protein
MTYADEKQGIGLGEVQNCGGVKPIYVKKTIKSTNTFDSIKQIKNIRSYHKHT